MIIILFFALQTFFGERCTTNHFQRIAILLFLQPCTIYSAFTASQRLRIYLDYQPSFNVLPDVQFYKDNVISPAVTYLQNTISPKTPLSTPILVDRDCATDFFLANSDPNKRVCVTDCAPITTCSNVTIPNTYLKQCYRQISPGSYQYTGTAGPGISGADIALLVGAIPCGGAMEASAVSCFSEPLLDRPILGIMNLCNDGWNPRFNIQMNINTIKHEIIHTLGFAADKFAYYRDQNGNPLTTRDTNLQPNLGYNAIGGFFTFSTSVGKTVTRTRSSIMVPNYSKTIYTLTLPTLLAEARSYFACPTLDGVDLQDSAAGTINSHFAKLFTGNELMSADTDAGEGQTSRLTLSLLQDTGWYSVDFTQAQNYSYGKGLGCNFLLNGCYNYITNNPSNFYPFCNALPTGYAMKCSDDRRYIYSCNIFKNIGLDPKFVYFNSIPLLPATENARNYAGDNAYKEFCPTNGKITFAPYTTDCNVANNNLRTDLDYTQFNDYYGSDSKCFDTTATAWTFTTPTTTSQPSFYGAKCFQYKCDHVAKILYIYFGGQTVCQATTQSKTNKIISNYLTAYINCPEYSNVCNNSAVETSTVSINELITKKMANKINDLQYWLLVTLGYILVFRC